MMATSTIEYDLLTLGGCLVFLIEKSGDCDSNRFRFQDQKTETVGIRITQNLEKCSIEPPGGGNCCLRIHGY
jgi:hypothetical protein